MSFASFRAERGITLEQCAIELELSPSSKGWLSEIENGRKDASLRLALRIERWSGGEVTAASVNAEIRGTDGGSDKPGLSADGHDGEPSLDDATVVAPDAAAGAGNPNENVPRTNASREVAA